MARSLPHPGSNFRYLRWCGRAYFTLLSPLQPSTGLPSGENWIWEPARGSHPGFVCVSSAYEAAMTYGCGACAGSKAPEIARYFRRRESLRVRMLLSLR